MPLTSSGPKLASSSQYRSIILADGPEAYWRLGDAVATGSAADATGHGHTGTINAPDYKTWALANLPLTAYWRLDEASGHFVDVKGGFNSTAEAATLTRQVAGALVNDADTAVGCDGAARPQIQVANNAALCGAFTAFTLAVWFKWGGSPSGTPWLVCEMDGLGQGGYRMYVLNGEVFFGVRSYASNGNVDKITEISSTTATYNDGNWHRAVGVFSASQVSLYVDGALQAGPTTHIATVDASTLGFDIGSADNFGGAWLGSLDEVMASIGTAWTANQIAEDYANGRRTVQPSGVVSKPGALTSDSDGAMAFDGSSSYVSVPGTGLGVAGSLSVEAWVYPTSLTHAGGGNFPTVIDKPNNLGNNYRVFVNTNGSVQFRVSGLSSDVVSAAGAVPLNAWTHLLCTWNGSTLAIYVNGVLAASLNPNGAPGVANNAGLAIGDSVTNGYVRKWQGLIDEVAVYKNALSVAQAANHYAAGLEKIAVQLKGGPTQASAPNYKAIVLGDGPVAYWRLDDAAPALTQVFADDFETGGGTTNLFTACGTDAREPAASITDWTIISGAPTKAANVYTIPALASMKAGHPDWNDITWTTRFQFAAGGISVFYLHYVDANNWIRAEVNNGGAVYLRKNVAGVNTAVASAVPALSAATWYWIVFQASGTTYTATLYADSAGAQGAAIAAGSVSGTISDAAIQIGQVVLEADGTGNTLVGGAFSGVCTVIGPCPPNWQTSIVNTGGNADPSFCWSSVQAASGTRSLSIYVPVGGSRGYWYRLNAVTTDGVSGYHYAGSVSGTGTAQVEIGEENIVRPLLQLPTSGWQSLSGEYPGFTAATRQYAAGIFSPGAGSSLVYFDLASASSYPAGVADLSGNGHTGIQANAANQVAGAVTDGDGAITLAVLGTGMGGQIWVPDSPALNFGTGSFTVGGWVKTLGVNLSSPRSSSLAIRKGATPGWGFGEGSNGATIGYRFGDGTTNLASSMSPGIGYRPQDTVGVWTHIVWVVDRAAQLLRLYVNATAQGTAAIGSVGSVSAVGNILSISPGAGAWFTNGNVDEVSVYAVALTPTQIKNHYLAGLERFAVKLTGVAHAA